MAGITRRWFARRALVAPLAVPAAGEAAKASPALPIEPTPPPAVTWQGATTIRPTFSFVCSASFCSEAKPFSLNSLNGPEPDDEGRDE